MEDSNYSIIECPECGERYILSSKIDLPSETASLFSDGFYIEPEDDMWRTPLVIGCVTCELGFLPENGKIIASGTLKDLLEKYPEAKKAFSPSVGALVLDLRARQKMDLNEERSIRREFWYATAHTDKGRELLSRNKKFEAFFIENQALLIECVNHPILRAELYRQAGKFDECLVCLKNETSSIAMQITQQAKTKNTKPFEVVSHL